MMRLSVFGLMLLLMGLISGCAYVSVPLVTQTLPLEEQVLEGEGTRKILLLDVTGVISEKEKAGGLLSRGSASMVSQIRESLAKAEKDDDISGIVVRINSPGGTVTASDIIYHDILAFKARKRVPVTACIMGLGTSGGYYIATAADEIVAHPTSVTGSIGVIVMTFNVEGLMTKVGVTEQSIKSGAKKDILSPFRQATPEELTLMQGIINELHARFVEVGYASRKKSLTRQQFEALADGRIFTADQAKRNGLIDKVGYLDEAIGDMKKTIRTDSARIVSYYRPGSYKGSIYADTVEVEGGVNALFGKALETFGESQFMYLWRP